MAAPRSWLTHLECARCHVTVDADRLVTLCACGGTYLARYDLESARRTLAPERAERGRDLWTWAEILPVRDPTFRRGLGEGGTPLLDAPRLAARLGLKTLLLKDEGRNPGGSFKARGMAVAMARAVELGAKRFALPSAGNAGGAAAAYGAAWGVPVHVAIPVDTPDAFRREIAGHGAHVMEVEGDIAAAGRFLTQHPDARDWFFLSTLREPYRVEGKKTMGYELAEQFDWQLPDVIVYPTGGGTGLIGMWKAFDEMEQMGWIGPKRPRMVTVQASGCAPIVKAFEEGKRFADEFPNAHTTASGLRVPKAIGDFLIIDALRASGGTAIAVTDEELIEATKEIGAAEGIFCAPEGAACLPALKKMMNQGSVKADERVVLFNTGSGVKYLESFSS